MGRVIVAVIWVLAGVASLFPAAMTPFLFDAPGSDSSPLTLALAAAVLLLPILFLVGGILWGLLRSRFFMLLPVIDLAVIVALFFAIDQYCGGNLAC